MSTQGRDDLKGPVDVAYYAPPKFRLSAANRPVLERLSRGERQYEVTPAPLDELAIDPLPPDDDSARRRFPVVGAAAIAVGCIAALTTLTFAFLGPGAKPSKPAVAASMSTAADVARAPQAASIQVERATVGETGPATVAAEPPPARQAADSADRAQAAPPPPSRVDADDDVALTSPLKLWALFPVEPDSTNWDSPVPTVGDPAAASEPPKAKDEDVAAKPKDEDAAPKAKDEAAAVNAPQKTAGAAQSDTQDKAAAAKPVRPTRRHRRQTRAAAATPSSTEPAAASANAQAQPTKVNPIQAAINTMLGK